MSTEDFIYLLMLILSIPFGHLVKISGSPVLKQFLCMCAGLFIAMSVVGLGGMWHSLTAVLVTFLIIKFLSPRWRGCVSFFFNFVYLFFFRTCHWYGLPKAPPYGNALQLVLVLKMITIAYEVSQSKVPIDEKAQEESKYQTSNNNKLMTVPSPSLYDVFSFGFCYCGLLTGPFFSYKTYLDMLHHENAEKISTVLPALRNLKWLPFYSAAYLVLNANFPISHIGSESYLNHPWGVLYQIAYLIPTFHWFRWRFYIGWLLAESCCMTLGLGAYPFESEPLPGRGPTKPVQDDLDPKPDPVTGDTHSFETIHNIKIYETEFSSTMRSSMKNWNMTVQWWIYQYVFKKIPVKSFRLTAVLIVSAFWHGVAPGYYLTFLSVPLVVTAETRMSKAVKPYLSPKLAYVYDWLGYLFLFRMFEYTGCGFMLLQLKPCWDAWKQMYFYGHILILILIIVPFFIPKKLSTEKVEKKVS